MGVKASVSVLRVPASLRRQPSCAPGTALVGFTQEGELNCQPLVQSNVSCPTGQFMNGVNADGKPTCVSLGANALSCASGEFLQGIKANGEADCKPTSIIVNQVSSTIPKMITQFAQTTVARNGPAPKTWQAQLAATAVLPRPFKTVESHACWIGSEAYTNSWASLTC
jgi:hypothetical protein